MSGAKGTRNYAFTDFVLDEDFLQSLPYKYLVYGKEICPDTGKQHLQGTVIFKDAKTETAARKALAGRHCEPCIDLDKSIEYCKKEGDYQEFGTAPVGAGKRTDLDHIREVIKKTGKIREVVNIAKNYQGVRMAEVILKYQEPVRNWKPMVKWYWGPTGTGKTKMAMEELEDPYIAMATSKWWEGYDAHENVIIDDMRGDFCKFHELLRMLDRYAYRIETKGGSRQFLAKTIIITSCYPPDKMFDTREDIQQLIRRIDEVKEFKEII